MRRVFSACAGSVMTLHTGSRHPGVVKGRTCPCRSIVATVAFTRGYDVANTLSPRQDAVVATRAHSDDLRVINSRHRRPRRCPMTGLT